MTIDAKNNQPATRWVKWNIDDTLTSNPSARVYSIPRGSEARAAKAVRDSGQDVVQFKIGDDSYVLTGRGLNPPPESLGIHAKDVVMKFKGKQGIMGTPLDRPGTVSEAFGQSADRWLKLTLLPGVILCLSAFSRGASGGGAGSAYQFIAGLVGPFIVAGVAGLRGVTQWQAKKDQSLDPKLFVPVAK